MAFGYSDTVNHALAFAAKYYAPPEGRPTLGYLTHPAHAAVILSRYGCDDATIVAGILHPVLWVSRPTVQHELRHKIADKFGSVVITTLSDAWEPRWDQRGEARPYNVCKLEYLGQLGGAHARALDVCTASEIHLCGSLTTDLRRLGIEYLPTISQATGDQLLWWYRSLLETLDARTDWTHRGMLSELRLLAAELTRHLHPDNR